MSSRHQDPRVSVWQLGATEADPWLVECPRCSRRAVRKAARVVCTACGYDRTTADRTERLWLVTPCCGEELFAVHETHLAHLESFVGATLRERRRDPEHGWSNQSLDSRLPRWMKDGSNREAVLRGLARLRKRLGES